AHQLAPDARSWTWLLREPESNLAEFSAWVEQVATLADPIHFAVVDQQRGKAVGSLALMRIDIAHGVVEVGHVHFSPLLSRTAMATEAHWLLMQYVFDTLGYRRYEWKCNSLNIPSARAARRLGFQYEGRFRQALVSKGHNRDTDWFSVIDGEWPELDNAMRQWLAADNFTADGQQRRSLESFR
ncbi:TPA: GNAT family N-acetyltransferase, partial [Klebsiella pneumoniae]